MTNKKNASEKELLCKVSTGDQEAFSILFDRYYIPTRNYIFKVTESQDVTEELIQEIFIKVWEKKELLPSVENFKSYLFILSRNKTLNHLRDLARTKTNQLYWLQYHTEDNYRIDSTDIEDEYHSIITHAISSLPPQQQKVYHLSRYKHLKHEEIASLMGLSKETVKKHMQHALAFLKEQVKTKAKEIVANFTLFVFFLF